MKRSPALRGVAGGTISTTIPPALRAQLSSKTHVVRVIAVA